MRTTLRETGYLRRSAYRCRLRGCRKGAARSGGADGGALDRASGQIPRSGRGAPAASSRQLPDWLADLSTRRRAHDRAAGRSGCGRTICSIRLARGARRSGGMNFYRGISNARGSDPSRLRPGGGDRQHAASGNRLARRLGRVRQPRRNAGRARHFAPARAHGVQGHHAAHGARRSPRRSRRSAAISMPRPASRPPPIMPAC